MEPKEKQYPVVDGTGDRSKVRCYKEQYCIGTWNVRSMNQGNMEVVKQEMARMNVDILGISELRWTGMGEFNSDDHYMYYCDIEWFALETNRDHSVIFEIASNLKNCISDSFVDYEGYSISSKGFLPTVVHIMVI